MPTLRDFADLLASTTSAARAASLAARLGFGDLVRADRAAQEALGIGDLVRDARIGAGRGQLRLLAVTLRTSADTRISAARVATRAATRAPHYFWLCVIADPRHHTTVIAVPPVTRQEPVAALVVDTAHVLPSDAETLATLAGATSDTDPLTHRRWREVLGRDALTTRFYKALEAAVARLADTATGPAPRTARETIALIATSRLLFLAFLEAKGWLDGDREFLRHQYDAACVRGGSVHRRLLEPLWFGTLNTPWAKRAPTARALGRLPFLNGGLFARAPEERAWRHCRLSDDAIGSVICDLLGRYRLTTREGSTSWTEAAVDPEMLGRAFESLMARDMRKRTGAFYTPRAMLERVTADTIDAWLEAGGVPKLTRDQLRDGGPPERAWRDRIAGRLSTLRILDPACGSGAFLVHALERVAELRAQCGDPRAVPERRRDVLERSIFGVDLNPTAVWLCELRLWLSVVIDATYLDPLEVPPLPNLDHHVRVGDALGGEGFTADAAPPVVGSLRTLRLRYARATGKRKRTLGGALDREERRLAIAGQAAIVARIAVERREVICAARAPNLFGERSGSGAAARAVLRAMRDAARGARRALQALRSGGALPFAFPTQFADAHAAGGFDLVVGNPPWVRVHHVAAASRAEYAARFDSWKSPAWAAGAAQGGASTGFASQADIAAPFLERALQLVHARGAVGLLVPAKLWSALSNGGIRRVVAKRASVRVIEDWSESPATFDAVVYPSMIVAMPREDGSPAPELRAAAHRGERVVTWSMVPATLAIDASPGAPWAIVPPIVRDAIDLLASRGTPLAASPFGRPRLGVKTGCNAAFVLEDGASPVEPELLRPALRGEDVAAWGARPRASLLFAHDDAGVPLRRLPERAARWLARWRSELDARTDARRGPRWGVFRVEAAANARPRVVWSDISREPRATFLAAGDRTIPLNTCYVAFARDEVDALTLVALLNSAVVGAWLSALAEPARGGYRRFLGWTLARLPLPADWDRARRTLAPIARRAMRGDVPDARSLALAAAAAYRLRLSRLEPLLTWHRR